MRKNMLNKTLIFFAMFCCTLLGGTISGVILNESDEPLPGANILIQGTSIGATTDINGEFQIRQLDVGKYDLRIDYIGYYEPHPLDNKIVLRVGLKTEYEESKKILKSDN